MGYLYKTLLKFILNISTKRSTGVIYSLLGRRSSLIVPYLTSRELGIQIKNVMDVGANEGLWTKSRKLFYSEATFVQIEANPKHIEKLRRNGAAYNIVLSDKEREVEFYFRDGGDGTGDSYYKENTVIYDTVKPTKIKTQTLSNLFKDNTLSVPNYLKLDTQGSELDIIRGCGKYIRNIDMISMELNLYDYNEGSPSIDEVILTLRNSGFRARFIIEQHLNKAKFEKGILNQVDILFVNERYLAIKQSAF